MLDLTLEAQINAISHPMARELRLRILLFGLKVLKSSSTTGVLAQWRLKDKILSAGLSWFNYAPSWSFGSNILQIKTELRLIIDVLAGIKSISYIAAHSVGSVKALQQKEQLLQILLESEQARLTVWVYPTDEGKHHQSHIMSKEGKAQTEVSSVGSSKVGLSI